MVRATVQDSLMARKDALLPLKMDTCIFSQLRDSWIQVNPLVPQGILSEGKGYLLVHPSPFPTGVLESRPKTFGLILCLCKYI